MKTKEFKIAATLIFIPVLCFIFCASVLAYTETVSSTGLPYDDFGKYSYFVGDLSYISDYGTKSTITAPISVTVRDKKSNIILSSDSIVVTFDNLPLSKTIAKEGELAFSASARFDFSMIKKDPAKEIDAQSIWDEYVGYSNNNEYQKTTLFGRPALVREYDGIASYYKVFLNDVIIPNAIVYFEISISADISLGAQRDTTQGDAFQKKYEPQQAGVFQSLKSQFDNITIKVEKSCAVRKYDDNETPAAQTQNNNASSMAGEITVPVAALIVLTGAAAAFIGAGAGNVDSQSDGKDKSSYKMAIKKDFGDSIKYNAETVYVYARMLEVPPEGDEIDRPDLTGRISIFSNDPLLEISTSVMSGSYMGAGIIAGKSTTASTNAQAVISFLFSGEGGRFQDNVKFNIIGESQIELDNENLYLLATSGRNFELPYRLVNFMYELDEVAVNKISESSLFDISVGKNAEGKTVIIATDKAPKKPTEAFFDSFPCEITAKNEKESARAVFYAVMCYEGVLPDFLGKEKEIIAYKNDKGEMPETDIAFRLGIWDDSKNSLVLNRPAKIEVNFTDGDEIYDVIGLEERENTEKSISDYLVYTCKAEKNLPSAAPVDGTLTVTYTSAEHDFESVTKVKLLPDLLSYQNDIEKEYQNCVKIIETYLPTRFREKKMHELNISRDKMGLKDLQLFRKTCWEIASRCIMQEKESYLIDSYWYDEAIATAELAVFIGDTALDIALAPFGGPITGFVISQVKSAMLELIAARIEKGSVSFNTIYDLVLNRLTQAAGQADGLIETPGFDKPKKLAAWLSCYILYRIMYHWYFDKDESGTPKGLLEGIQNGLMDFAGKGISILLGEFAKDVAKKRGIDLDSTADKEQKWVNEQVEGAAKKGLDAMDKLASSLDKKIEEIIATLSDAISKIRSGALSF